MAPRAQWNGFLRLSLVSCPVSLYPAATAAERVSFRQVNRETGNRLRQQLVDSVTGEVVDTVSKGRGYEVGDNTFLVVPDEELKAAEQEARTRPFSPPLREAAPQVRSEEPPRQALQLVRPTRRAEPPAAVVQPPAPEPPPVPRPIPQDNRTIELDRFVARAELDPRYYLAPYYVAPRDEVGQEAFAVIREAMSRQRLAGMGRVVLANRERPIIIEPMGRGLRAFTLHYAHEIRGEAEYFGHIPPLELPEDMLELTEMILSSKKGEFDTTFLEDRYRTVLVDKLRKKQSELPPRAVAPRPSSQNVVNLMDALKRSLAEQKPPAPSRSSPRSLGKSSSAAPSPKKAPARTVKPRSTR